MGAVRTDGLSGNGYCSGDGGVFAATPNTDLANLTGETTSFSTFCLERTEYIDLNITYSVVVNGEAILGGANGGPAGPGGGDPLDPRIACLYSEFRAGTLTDHDYTAGPARAGSAEALQDVIWYLENEMDMTWTADSLQDTFYQATQNAVDPGSGSVWATSGS